MSEALVRRPLLGVVGRYQLGKSSLVNCLLDDAYSPTGEGLVTTTVLTRFYYGEAEEVLVHRFGSNDEIMLERREDVHDAAAMAFLKFADNDEIRIWCWKPLLQSIDILDTPGISAKERDDRIALAGVSQSDFLIIVLSDKELLDSEKSLLDEITRRNTPFAVIFNCRELPDPADPQVEDVCCNIGADMRSRGHNPLSVGDGRIVWSCNLLWAWHAQGHLRRESAGGDDKCRKYVRHKIKLIEAHFKECYERGIPTPRELMARSKFLPIRALLQGYSWQSLEAHRMAESHRLLDGLALKWERALRDALSE